MKPLQIFKPGRFTAMSGHTLEFGESDVEAIAAGYDPSVFPAPLVCGHPKHDDPAYGWAKSLAFADDVLTLTDADQVEPAFAEAIEKGRYKKISVSLYPPTHPNNPKPGQFYLRHIGFLGAMAPAVPGLKPITDFAEDGCEVLEFGTLDSWETKTLGGLLRGLREWFIGKFGTEEADKAIPNWSVSEIEAGGMQPDPEPVPSDASSYAEGDGQGAAAGASSTPAPATPAPAQVPAPTKENALSIPATKTPAEVAAEKDADLTRREEELKQKQAALDAKQAELDRSANASFCEQLQKAGKLTPAISEGLVDFMCGLDGAPELEFGEGDQKVKKSSLDFFKEFLGRLPKLVEFGEFGGSHKAPKEDADSPDGVEFAAPAGFTVTQEGLQELGAARAYAKDHGCDLLSAVAAIAKGASK